MKKSLYFWDFNDPDLDLNIALITELWRDFKTPEEISKMTKYPLHQVYRIMKKNLLID